MKEISWGWPEIACVLMWKLAPEGVVLTRKDLGRLPQDRVLVDDRDSKQIRFSFIGVEAAERLRRPIVQSYGYRASVSELQGRWKKLAVVLLWKLAKEGVVLTQADRDRVPADKILLTHGHEQDLECRFVPRLEAARIQKWEAENEGKAVMERV